MEAALEICKREKKVAFGSQLQEMFYDVATGSQRLASGTRVLICVSLSGNEGEPARKYFKGDAVTYEATYIQWEPADSKGEHRHPQYRPASTQATDTAF